MNTQERKISAMGERPSGGIATRRERQWGAIVFMVLGLVAVFSQIALNVYSAILRFKNPNVPQYEVNHWVLAIGGALGFVGFGIFDLKRALEGGGFISDVVLDLASIARTGKIADRAGRRSTDPLVVQASVPQPSATPTSQEKSDGT